VGNTAMHNQGEFRMSDLLRIHFHTAKQKIIIKTMQHTKETCI